MLHAKTDTLYRNFDPTRMVNAPALVDVGLHIDRGNCIALRGPSGCLKFTTRSILGGQDRPNSGVALCRVFATQGHFQTGGLLRGCG